MTTEQKTKPKIELPKEVKKDVLKNPQSMVVYGLPKAGKTTALSQLPNCLIIDTEKGTGFIEGAYVMNMPQDMGPVSKFRWLKEVAAQINEEGHPYDYVCIDTLTELDVLAEWVGTFNYMNSSQGKKFNRDDKTGEVFKPTDPNYESVLTLGQGYGYRYSREAILDIFETLKGLGKVCTIFVCHVTDKMISKNGSEEVMVKDLALVGKVKDIIPRNVDAVANIYNEDGDIMISFAGSESKVGGVRAKHLIGYSGKLNWDKIFIK